MIKSFIQTIGGTILILALAYGAGALSTAVGSPVPGAVVGLVICAAIFGMNGKVPGLFAAGARMLFRVFPLLFIPALVSMTPYVNVVADNLALFVGVVVLSTLLGLGSTAFILSFLNRGKG